MTFLLNGLTELPLILSLSFAIYLSFEYWRFPDLTVETVFVSGMVATYLGAITGDTIWQELFLTLVFSVFFVILYSSLTFGLFMLRFPPLFAGLVVLLSGYSFNFFLNGRQTTQNIYINGSALVDFFKESSPDGTLRWLWWVGLFLTLLVIVGVFIFDGSNTGAKLRLSRQIDNRELIASFSRAPTRHLLVGMMIYNGVAVTGGVAWGLSNTNSSVEALGVVTVGLATMFLIRAMRSVAAAPSRNEGKASSGRRAEALLLKLDQLGWIFVIALLASIALSLLRHSTTQWVTSVAGVVNALTAVSIIVVWALVVFWGGLMGRQLPEDGKN